jgi:hypothetical protein
MRQALHIFRKDSRQCRYAIALVLVWTAIFAIARIPPDAAGLTTFAGVFRSLSWVVFPLLWVLLIGVSIQAEALAGDRQFWLTRPYGRGSLFAAKMLFIAAYVQAPLLVAQLLILTSHGFGPRLYLAGLLWNQALVFLVVALPAAALAALVPTFVQFVFTGLTLPVLFVATGGAPNWGALDWLRSAAALVLIAAVAATVLALQFTRRSTAPSRVIGLAGVLVILAAFLVLPWRAGFAMQAHVGAPWEGPVRAELVAPESRSARTATGAGNVYFRVHVVGPSAGTPMLCHGGEVTATSAGGRIWRSGLSLLPAAASPSVVPEGCQIFGRVGRDAAELMDDTPVTVRASVYITLLGAERTASMPIGSPVVIPDVGVCSGATRHAIEKGGSNPRDRGFTRIDCDSAFRTPSRLTLVTAAMQPLQPAEADLTRARLIGSTDLLRFSLSPFPSTLRFDPIDRTTRTVTPVESAVVTTLQPFAPVRADVTVPGLHLRDFESFR